MPGVIECPRGGDNMKAKFVIKLIIVAVAAAAITFVIDKGLMSIFGHEYVAINPDTGDASTSYGYPGESWLPIAIWLALVGAYSAFEERKK